MKKIEDYIHMYIGSDIMCYNIKYKLKGVCSRVDGEDGLRIQMRVFEVGTGNRTLWADHDEVKLLLRPLSSMTEEEAIELCKFDVSNKRQDNIDIHEIQDTYIWYTDGETWYGDGVSEMYDKYLKYNEMSANQMHWLISKGFDLFGLIESGLALDSTKN